MPASLSSAFRFSDLSGSVAVVNSTRGLDFKPLGLSLRLGGSAGPRSLSGVWHKSAPLMPQASANCDGPEACCGCASSTEDDDAAQS